MNKDLKIVVQIFHKDTILGHIENSINDDVLKLQHEGPFYLTNAVCECANKAVKMVFSK